MRRDSNPGQLGKKHERYLCAMPSPIKVLRYLQQIFANELRFRPPIPSSGLSLASNLSLFLPLRPKPVARTADLNGMTRSAGRRFPDTDHQQPEHRTDRRQLLTEICSDFFSENAPNPIPLTNQVRNPIWNGWSFRRIFNFCQYNMVSISLLSLLVALIKLRGATLQQNVF